MSIVPNTNVNLATHVRDALNSAGGSVNNDLTTFFEEPAKIRMWAEYKPFIMAKDFPTDIERNSIQASGLSVVEDKTSRPPFAIYTYEYKLPSGGTEEPLRLGDFRGYNSEAKAAIEKYTIWDPSTDSYVNGSRDINADYAEVWVNVTFPDIYPGKVPVAPITNIPGYGTMEIVEYQGTNRVTLYKWDFADIENNTPWEDYKNQTLKKVTLIRTYDLPEAGELSRPFDLYLTVNGCEVAKCTGNIIQAGWIQNPEDESQWRYATVTDECDEVISDYVFYTAIQYLEAKNATFDSNYVRIKNFYCGASGARWTLYIDARNNQASDWVNVFNISSIAFYQQNIGAAQFVGGINYQTAFNDYTHTINGNPATVKCLDMTMKVTSGKITELPCTEYRIRVVADLT